MSEINNRFRVKKGLDVQGGDASFSGNVDVAGAITTPTPAPTENSTKVATTAFVLTAINSLINGAPGALDTLNELATALGNDPNFATTITNQLALKAPLASPALTGTPTAPTASNGDNSSTIATTAFVKNQAYAPLTSPALVGIPTAPTAAVGTNTTQLSTTAFVQAAMAAYGIGNVAAVIPGGTNGSIDSTSIASGIYQVVSANTGTKPTGDSSGFLLVTQGIGSALIHQMYYDDTTARVFSRAYASSAWTAWREAAYLDSPAFTGTPTAPTPAQFDNTTKIATTAFVKQTQGNAAGTLNFNTNQTLTTGQCGFEIQYYGPSGGVFTLPSAATIPGGYGYNIYNQGTGTLTIQVAGGSDFLWSGSSLTSITLQKGDNVVLTGRGTTEIDITGGTASLQYVQGPLLISPAISGTPTAPTAAPGTNSTQLATTAYADAIAALKANIANPAFTGNATFAGSLSSSDYTSFPFVGGGSYNSSTASVTGSVKIKLPVAYTSTMVSFDIDVIEGPTDSAFKIRISGFLASSTSTWSGVTVNQVGGVNSRLPNVRFGNDGTNSCVWIGELADTWAYPNISVSNVHVAYGGLTSAWQSPWSIAFVTTFDTVKVGPIAANKAAYLNSPAFTGRVTVGGTADDGTNVLQLNGSMRAANYYINSQATGDSGLTGFGNANGPAVAFYGTGTAGAGALVFRTANAERARFSPAGKLLIGTTTDDGTNSLQVLSNISTFRNASPNQSIQISAAVTNNINSYSYTTNASPLVLNSTTDSSNSAVTAGSVGITFQVLGATKASITQSGRVIIGNQSDDGSNLFQSGGDIASNGGVFRSLRFGNFGSLVMNRAEGTYAAPTAVIVSQIIGGMIARGYDGGTYRDVASINIVSNGAVTSGDSSGFLTLNTTPTGATATTERMRLTSSGRVLVGTTSDDGSSILQINGIATATTPTVGDISTKVATTSFTQQTADNSAIVYSIVFG